jgi:hypothetical protein
MPDWGQCSIKSKDKAKETEVQLSNVIISTSNNILFVFYLGRALLFFTISSLLMGGTWFPHVLLDDTQTEYGYLTGVLSCLVGVFFLIFFVWKKRVLMLLLKKLHLNEYFSTFTIFYNFLQENWRHVMYFCVLCIPLLLLLFYIIYVIT